MVPFWIQNCKSYRAKSKLQNFSTTRHLELIRNFVFLLKLCFQDLIIFNKELREKYKKKSEKRHLEYENG
jgi:hypothetical protein